MIFEALKRKNENLKIDEEMKFYRTMEEEYYNDIKFFSSKCYDVKSLARISPIVSHFDVNRFVKDYFESENRRKHLINNFFVLRYAQIGSDILKLELEFLKSLEENLRIKISTLQRDKLSNAITLGLYGIIKDIIVSVQPDLN